MTLRVAVDFGTSSTCAAMSRGGAPPQVVVVDGAPVVPSAVYAAPDGRLFVGPEAQQQAGIDPARYEPHPKRRIDEGELLLGTTVVPVVEVVRAVLARMVSEARRAAGGQPVDQLVLTHPAEWGPVRAAVLRQAADPLAEDIILIPEPVAATLCYVTEAEPSHVTEAEPSHVTEAEPSTVVAVLDIGGGTVDASVVRRRADAATPLDGCTILATRGDPTFGGADIDQALLEHVGAIAAPTDPLAWRILVEGRELADRRRRRVLLADVRTAKETLSRHPYADVPLPSPFPDVHITRAELERLITPALGAAVALLEAALADAGYGPGRAPPAEVFLVGGSSRIPLVARLIHERTGIVPRASEVPETVVALGAARPVSGDASYDSHRHSPRTAPVSGDASHSSHRHSQARSALLAGVLVVGVAGAVVLATGNGAESTGQRIARYGYSFELIPGWEQAGGDARLREVRLTPSPRRGPEEVLVQENQLGYDSGAEPERPRRELQVQLAAAQPGHYTDFDPDASFAGRTLAYYRESPGDGSTVDWYLLFEGKVQVNIGCRHTPAVAGQVERACREVVRTLRIR